ncbi:AAA family ATPase [Rhizobium sp. S152]|uniref:AAA family ATPase n=1 Tax=Rhizobium sp. S152 TaxID=3055038 RepID=UPI0025A9C5F5|nr:AAA family ATPase [Rhizobium sp. S152]MDM9628481.1 AAA family ATPase [Rhizobium sp. S152]
MQFVVHKLAKAPVTAELHYPFVGLYQDNWNDYGWRSRFVATLHVSDKEAIDLGPLRIAHDNKGFRANTTAVLEALPKNVASLGESIAYYRRIRDLHPDLQLDYLDAVGDIVSFPERRDLITKQELWEESFLREVSSRHAFDRGGYYINAPFVEVDPPNFDFRMQLPGAAGAHDVKFDFSGHGGLPNRTMLLIGRNGTGKTQLLSSLAFESMADEVFEEETIKSMPKAKVSADLKVSRVITISYNVFDEFPLPKETSARRPRGVAYRSRASYKYCGLRTRDGTINANEVDKMLAEALEPVAASDRMERLVEVLATLFDQQQAEALTSDDDQTRKMAVKQLSAGQRLVAAIFSNIVGFIEEGALLLIDEPETNLHPGLLSSVVDALNRVLEEFDSYAIVATHSPILLQQIPSRYVRVVTRNNLNMPSVKPLTFESFGEDLGELTRKVLDLTGAERDFRTVLDDLFDVHKDAKGVAELFPYPLGIPAQSHLFALEIEQDDEAE